MGVKLEKAKEIIKMANDLLYIISLEDLKIKFKNISIRKQEQEFIEYQRPKNVVNHYLDPGNDKVFPLETISINSYRTDYKSDLKTATIHTGAYANELAMRMNALAFVVGEDIYFRNGAYKPENEEGRKILAHELTHVVQYDEKRITKNADFERLEKEAERAENQTEHVSDPYEPYPINKKLFYLRRSQIEMVTRLAADKVEKWLLEQKIIMDEKEYFELLCAYHEWLDEGL